MAGEHVACSFCERPISNVRLLIAGPKGVAICDECTYLSAGIVAEDRGRKRIEEWRLQRARLIIFGDNAPTP